jgi:hypothetical protein
VLPSRDNRDTIIVVVRYLVVMEVHGGATYISEALIPCCCVLASRWDNMPIIWAPSCPSLEKALVVRLYCDLAYINCQLVFGDEGSLVRK